MTDLKTVYDFDAETLESAEEFLALASQDKEDEDYTAHISDSVGDDIHALNIIKSMCGADARHLTDIEAKKLINMLRDRMLVSVCEGYKSGAIV